MAVYVVDHPLVRHKLGILRMGATSTREFRSVSNEIARLLIYEATKGFRTEKHTVEGWAGPVEIEAISGKMVTVVPILRAGLGLMDGVLARATTHITGNRFAESGSSLADLPTIRAYLARARIRADQARTLRDDTVAALLETVR